MPGMASRFVKAEIKVFAFNIVRKCCFIPRNSGRNSSGRTSHPDISGVSIPAASTIFA